jgi:hypothetical protein
MIRRTFLSLLAAALLGLALTPAPLPAAEPQAAPAGPTAVFARQDYWEGFFEFWTSRLKRTDGVVLLAVGVGALSLFIITRNKWIK